MHKGRLNLNPGGDGEIRTLDTLASILAFQASALGHYATSPENYFVKNIKKLFFGLFW